MKIDANWFSTLDPMIKVTIGDNSLFTKHNENT